MTDFYLIPLSMNKVYINGVNLKEYYDVPQELIDLENAKKEVLFEDLNDQNKYLEYERYVSYKYKNLGYPEYIVAILCGKDLRALPDGEVITSDYPAYSYFSTKISILDSCVYVVDTNYYPMMETLKEKRNEKKLIKK